MPVTVFIVLTILWHFHEDFHVKKEKKNGKKKTKERA